MFQGILMENTVIKSQWPEAKKPIGRVVGKLFKTFWRHSPTSQCTKKNIRWRKVTCERTLRNTVLRTKFVLNQLFKYPSIWSNDICLRYPRRTPHLDTLFYIKEFLFDLKLYVTVFNVYDCELMWIKRRIKCFVKYELTIVLMN